MIEPVGDHARDEERAAIVAWLRIEAIENLDSEYEEGAMAHAAFMYAIDAIERGDHLGGGE